MTNHNVDSGDVTVKCIGESGVKPESNISRRGWRGNSARHAEVGSVGGNKVAEDREHMAEIGKIGGSIVSQNRTHMSEIGRKGGLARAAAAHAKKTTEANQDENS